MACLTNSIFRQIFFWGLLLICLKCTKEITSADPRIIRYILHRDRIGVTGCNIILCPLHINLPEVVFFLFFFRIVNKHGQHGIKSSCHSCCRFICRSSHLIDLLQLPPDQISRNLIPSDHRPFSRKISCPYHHSRIGSHKSCPCVLPRIIRICIILDLCIRIQNKTVSLSQMIYFFICHIGPLSRNNMVDTIMIPDSRSPLLLRSALLISHIINGKRTQKIISYFIGVFVCLFHALLSFPPICSSPLLYNIIPYICTYFL